MRSARTLRGDVQNIFFSKAAQVVWAVVLFFWGVLAVRHYYWPLYDIKPTYMLETAVFQLVGVVMAFMCLQYSLGAAAKARNMPKGSRGGEVGVAIACFAVSVAGLIMVASTLFQRVGKYPLKLDGVMFHAGSQAVPDYVAAGRLTLALVAFFLMLIGTLFCGPVARKSQARPAPRERVMAGAE